MASALRQRIHAQTIRDSKIQNELKNRPKEKDKPISLEEHNKRLEMLKNIGILRKD